MIMFSFGYGAYYSLQFGQFLLLASHSSMQLRQNNRSQFEHCYGSSTTFVHTKQFRYSLSEFSNTAWLYCISVEKLIYSILASGQLTSTNSPADLGYFCNYSTFSCSSLFFSSTISQQCCRSVISDLRSVICLPNFYFVNSDSLSCLYKCSIY